MVDTIEAKTHLGWNLKLDLLWRSQVHLYVFAQVNPLQSVLLFLLLYYYAAFEPRV